MTIQSDAATASVVDTQDRKLLRTIALSRWENEGGAYDPAASQLDTPHPLSLDASELTQLKVRIIALENVLIAMLAEAPPRHFSKIREMANFIMPRSGYTLHPLTIHAAEEMLNLVDRANRFNTLEPDSSSNPL